MIFIVVALVLSWGQMDFQLGAHSDEVTMQEENSPSSWLLEVRRIPQWERRIIEDYFTEITRDREITQAIMINAEKHEIPYSLAFALAKRESSFNTEDLSYNSRSVDRGLFQLNSQSFPELSVEECFDPWISADKGLGYLRYCWNRGGNATVALAMYNAGPTRVETQGTPEVTMNYIHRIYQFRDHFDREIEARLIFDPEIFGESEKTVKNISTLMEQTGDIN